jgi:long-chain fatty acid transport protein
MEVGDNGAEAMGRGGAFVAKADSPAAINYNPAGFAKLRGWQTVVSANMVYAPLDFQRAGRFSSSNGDGLYPTVQNNKALFVVPMQFALTTDFNYFKRLTLAVGAYGPSAVGRQFDSAVRVGSAELAAPQRFDTTSGTEGSLILFPTVGFGYRIHEKVDLGLTFQWALTSLKMGTLATVGAACPDNPEDPSCDVAIDLEGKDWFAPSGSAGILVRPFRGLELGGMVRLPSTSEMTGKAKVSFGPGVQKLAGYMQKKMLDPEEPTVQITNSYPWMFRLGARYAWLTGDEEKADIEINLTYERWSSTSKKLVQIDAVSLGKPLEPVAQDWKLKDTMSVRVGGAYRFRLASNINLTLRAGAFAETESTAVSDTSLTILGPQRLGLTGGLGLKWGAVSVDVAYAHLFFPDRVVERSTLTAQDFGGGVGPTVGNGVYRGSFDGFYVSLGTSFGGAPAVRRRPAEEPHFARRAPARLASASDAVRSKGAPAEDEDLRFEPSSRPSSRPATRAQDPYNFGPEAVELSKQESNDPYSFSPEPVERSRKVKKAKHGARKHRVAKRCLKRRGGRCVRFVAR